MRTPFEIPTRGREMGLSKPAIDPLSPLHSLPSRCLSSRSGLCSLLSSSPHVSSRPPAPHLERASHSFCSSTPSPYLSRTRGLQHRTQLLLYISGRWAMSSSTTQNPLPRRRSRVARHLREGRPRATVGLQECIAMIQEIIHTPKPLKSAHLQ